MSRRNGIQELLPGRHADRAWTHMQCVRCGIGIPEESEDQEWGHIVEYCDDCRHPEFRLAEYGQGPFRIQPSGALWSSEIQAA